MSWGADSASAGTLVAATFVATSGESVSIVRTVNKKASGVYILVDFSKEYKYSLLFGDVITHEFKTLEALENWNSDCNSFIVAINISIAISKIKGE